MYSPGVTDGILGEWTDLGIMGAIESEQFSVFAYLMRGEMPDSVYDNVLATDKGLAGGLRATFSPIEGLTLGLSYALNAHYIGDKFSLLAGDIEFEVGPLALAFEYVAMMPKFKFGDRVDLWFAQAMFSLEDIAEIPLEFGARFDYFCEDIGIENAITIQANFLPDEHLRCGLALRIQKDEDYNKTIMLQVMGMF
jgi:hypothetical protein